MNNETSCLIITSPHPLLLTPSLSLSLQNTTRLMNTLYITLALLLALISSTNAAQIFKITAKFAGKNAEVTSTCIGNIANPPTMAMHLQQQLPCVFVPDFGIWTSAKLSAEYTVTEATTQAQAYIAPVTEICTKEIISANLASMLSAKCPDVTITVSAVDSFTYEGDACAASTCPRGNNARCAANADCISKSCVGESTDAMACVWVKENSASAISMTFAVVIAIIATATIFF